jgi:hypothetical protein
VKRRLRIILSSHVETAFILEPLASTTVALPRPLQLMADNFFVPAVISIISAIVLVGALMTGISKKGHESNHE